jgi:DNA adenine methylase
LAYIVSKEHKRLKPLLKWPGGKRTLLPEIKKLIPSYYQRYYEPFVGGGALFFDLSPKNAIIADHNQDLICCYTQIRDNAKAVINVLDELLNSKDEYYRIRAWNPTDDIEKAARLLYLVSLSFNGLYRVNLKGVFNVPYGFKLKMNPCCTEKIIAASSILQQADIISMDFEKAVITADAGDFIYFDPPYTVAHSNNGFIKYNAKIFSWEDQIRLAALAHDLVKKGCHVIISNADHPSLRKLYSDFDVHTVKRPSTIAAAGASRGRVTECLFFKEINS